MLKYRGLWLPNNETHLQKVMDHEGKPIIDGKPTFQYRKYAHALKLVRNHRHAVDIGAHCGLWSRVMIKDFKRVTAFEPMPECHECFELNIPKDERQLITLHHVALGRDEGEVQIAVDPKSSGWTHVATAADTFPTVNVPVMRLDSYDLHEVDFIKIDVEGYEWFVLMGGEATIRRERPVIIVEQKHGTKDRYGLKEKAAVKQLMDWGMNHDFDFGGDHILNWLR